MSLEQYKDKTRQELLVIMDIQAEEYQRLLNNSDKRITELERSMPNDVKINWSMKERIAELESERDIRDLRQQAKGARKASELDLSEDETWNYASQFIETLADDILNQAKALKEQGE